NRVALEQFGKTVGHQDQAERDADQGIGKRCQGFIERRRRRHQKRLAVDVGVRCGRHGQPSRSQRGRRMSLVAPLLCQVRILLANGGAMPVRPRPSGLGRRCGTLLGGRGQPMRLFSVVCLTSGLLACAPAMAEDIDLSAWTCKQFLSASKEDVGVIWAWLDGYYKEEDEPPVIDTDALVIKAKKLGQYCSAHPDSELIGATDKLFQKQ